MKPCLLFLLGSLLAGAAGCSSVSPSFDKTKYGTVDYDVTYCTPDGSPQKMDIYYPSSGGPWAAILSVHGGGWVMGDKSEVVPGMEENGYLAVSINYRLYPEARFPAMIQDVKCAIRFLRAHAGEYNLDPDRIGLDGGSAGGHLVALAGLADESAGFDVGEYLDQPSRVQAVLVVAGPADLTGTYPEWAYTTFEQVFGADQLVSASPVTYISPDDPPFLILHGDKDTTIPVEQGYLLDERLLAAGVSSQLVIVHNADHGFGAVGGPISPGWEELIRITLDFWEENLR